MLLKYFYSLYKIFLNKRIKNNYFKYEILNINYFIYSLYDLYYFANLNFKNKNYYESIYYYSLIVKYYPKSDKLIESLIKIGDILKIKKEYNKSIFIYEQVLNIDTNNNKELIKIINKLKKIINN